MIILVDIELPIRLDRYLKKLYPNLTQGIIQKALRQKKITVNSAKVEGATRINAGDQIFINDSLNLVSTDTPHKKFSNSVISLANKLITEYLVYQDNNLYVINKPSSIATQGGSKINLSIDDALQYLNSLGEDLRLVHRLDKDTSGILLIAKNYLASIKLMRAFQEKIIQKTYLAVTLGKLLKQEGEIRGMIAKSRVENYETMENDEENGKLAITHYKLLEFQKKSNISLIEFTPLTGRMHQLRFHAKILGCPIIGDIKYGSNESIALSKNMLLHAKKITLPAEVFGEEIIIEVDLPGYFYKLLPWSNNL
ncbi:MAG: RluA family pseudouridine synthase [Rickettsia endosymbiont of Bryobia graminum]|nr:RluA family pseudouridine synthase [Rickettsia endosymbiont of Bryobia graminum]